MLIRGSAVTPDGVIEDAIVEIRGERILQVRPAGRTRFVDATADWILPGFVDMHVHGGGGKTFTTHDPKQARAVAAFHARHGTTTMLASLVTAPEAVLRKATEAYLPLIDEGILAGVHYEGPYLSPARCGAQNPAHLRDPDLAELGRLLDIGGVAMVTIAPELPGAIDAIRMLRDRGVIAAIGHTDATYEQTVHAIEAGASVATHLANAMRPLHHRDPGPIAALLNAPDVVCELIADGVHLHDGMLDLAIQAAGPGRVALVTDAIAAAGMRDGRYDLGGLAVTVKRRVARLTADGSLAGSTLTMDAALRHIVHNGWDIADAAAMAATTPARALGLDDRGAIAPGLRADLVLLDNQLRVVEVLRGGETYGRRRHQR